ncbi:MAG: DUF4956 domain-containing protein [Bacteroidetes bacterium]|nr:DUF4956 domain-containing protein [Bacteroidota bacterium]MBR3090928.1 DUF4956 domain-containing protein [Bacteroidota bacterium]
MKNEFNEITNTLLFPSIGTLEDILQLLIRFILTILVTSIIIRLFYYKKTKRNDWMFTFSAVSVSVFLLIFLLGSIKIQIGLALGIFAIFGIIRYRTEMVPIREMTYLFIIISISVINALAIQFSYAETIITNIIFILSIWLFEVVSSKNQLNVKYILYDKIHLITPDKRQELISDLEKRTGLKIIKIDIGHIDFIRDSVMLNVYYKSDNNTFNTVDQITRLPKQEQ